LVWPQSISVFIVTAMPENKFHWMEDVMMLFYSQQKGQGLVEYSLILVLVAVVVFAALMILGPVVGNAFSSINNSLTNV
jgi:pilus assembly protein Flp/PilA